MSKFLSKPGITRPDFVGDLRPGSCDLLSTLPALAECLIETAYGDGTPRRTSTLMTFVEDGVLKLCLNDRQEGMVCFVTGDTWIKALTDLEAGLQHGGLDWRQSKKGKK